MYGKEEEEAAKCEWRDAEECDGEINEINKDKRSEKVKWGGAGVKKKNPTEDEDVGFEGSAIQIRPFSVWVWRLKTGRMMTSL